MLHEIEPGRYVNPLMVTTVEAKVQPAEEKDPGEFETVLTVRSACGATTISKTYHHDEVHAKHALDEELNHLRFAMQRANR